MRRAGAVLLIGASPVLVMAFTLGAFYWNAKSSLNARADRLERDLVAQSTRESRRAPFDWPPYRDIVSRLRGDPDGESQRLSLPPLYPRDVKGIVEWINSGCRFKDWTSTVDVGFDNRH